MQKFGYFDQDGPQALIGEGALVTALKLVQKFGGIEQTGIFDNDTLKVCTFVFQLWWLKWVTFEILLCFRSGFLKINNERKFILGTYRL